MDYRLVLATASDEGWLEQLRRSVYQELFVTTFGAWDEARHQQHADGCWSRGNIFLIEVENLHVGMIQLVEDPHVVEISELQIAPPHQNRGLGSHLVLDIIGRAHGDGKPVVLWVGLKNERAYRLYLRLGFRQVSQTAAHRTMINESP
ncbi:MAG: GNAT family N-acetyltransferase [Vicinamibacterales bacterium]